MLVGLPSVAGFAELSLQNHLPGDAGHLAIGHCVGSVPAEKGNGSDPKSEPLHPQECETFTPVARLTFGGRIHSAGRAGSVWRRKMRSTSDQNPAWEVLQRAAVALVRSTRPRAENQRIESDFGVVPGWWGMTSPVYSALPQELLLEAEPRRPDKKTPRLVNNKENNRTRDYSSSDRPLTHVCNSRGWPRGSRWKESLPFYQPSGGETAQRWKMVDCERHQTRT